MFDLRKILLTGLILTAGLARAQGRYEGTGVREITELSVDEYTRLALQESINAQISRHSLSGNTFNRQVSYLSLRFPALTANSTLSRSELKVSNRVLGGTVSTDNQNDNYDTSLTYAQPVYLTGGAFQAVLDQNESRSVSEGSDPVFAGIKPQLNLTFTQPLFLFVQDPNKRTWRRTELSYENQLDQYETDRLNVVFDARTLYYQVLLNLAQLGVQKNKLRSSDEVQKITRALVNAGRVPPIELNRVTLRFHTDERTLQNSRVIYWQILNNAKDKVGVARDTVVIFSSTMTYVPFNASVEKLIEYAYIHQPSIRSARRNVELAEIGLRESQESTSPRFALSGSVGRAHLTGGNVTSGTTVLGLPVTTGGVIADWSQSWSAGANVTWPFFDSFKTHYAILANQENLIVARLQLQSAERNTQVSVANAYADVKRTEEQIIGFGLNRSQAMENVRIVKARYRQGLDRLVDVFDAESQARDIDLEYFVLLFSYSQAVDNLSRLVGGDVRKIK